MVRPLQRLRQRGQPPPGHGGGHRAHAILQRHIGRGASDVGAGATADVAAGGDGGVGVDVLVREPDPVGVFECVFDDDCELLTMFRHLLETEKVLDYSWVDLLFPCMLSPPFSSFFPLRDFGGGGFIQHWHPCPPRSINFSCLPQYPSGPFSIS